MKKFILILSLFCVAPAFAQTPKELTYEEALAVFSAALSENQEQEDIAANVGNSIQATNEAAQKDLAKREAQREANLRAAEKARIEAFAAATPDARVPKRPVVGVLQSPNINTVPVQSTAPANAQIQSTLPVQSSATTPQSQGGGTASTFSLIESKGISGTLAPKEDKNKNKETAAAKETSKDAAPQPLPQVIINSTPTVTAPAAPAVEPKKKEPKKRDFSIPSKGWKKDASSNFNIFIDDTRQGLTIPGIPMLLEGAYSTMRMNMPMPMPTKSNVYIYKNKSDYLKGEFKPFQWSEAVFYPGYATIVLFIQNKDAKNLKRVFMHEYTHMINEDYFNPGSKGPSMPMWLDEGMAVNVEDISESPSGGAWAKDLVTYDIRAAKNASATKGGSNVIYFLNFKDFMKAGSFEAYSDAGKVQDWYLQAYAMLRFLWKPYNASTPENQMQFRNFLTLASDGEVQYSQSGRILKTANGDIDYKKYTVEEALKKAYGMRNMDDFETKFWLWYQSLRKTPSQNKTENKRVFIPYKW